MTNAKRYDTILKRECDGSLVKRLRHGPLKAETGVRFSHESPKRDRHSEVSAYLFFATCGRIELCTAAQRARCGVRNTALLGLAERDLTATALYRFYTRLKGMKPALFSGRQILPRVTKHKDTQFECPFFVLGDSWSNELSRYTHVSYK